MKKTKILFLLEVIWESVRILFVFFLAAFIKFRLLLWDRQTVLWIILLGSSQFLMPAGFILLIFDSIKYNVVIQLLRIGKILNLFAGLFIFIEELVIKESLLFIPQLYSSPVIYFSVLIIALTVFIDLIFLYFLLSYKVGSITETNIIVEASTLPDFSETEVNNEIISEKPKE